MSEDGWIQYSVGKRDPKTNEVLIWRPVISSVKLFGPKGVQAQADMLVDTGGLRTFLDEEFAAAIGIDINKCPEAKAYAFDGSEVNGRLHIVDMGFPGASKLHSIEVFFTDKVSGFGILGQESFLSNFKATFEFYNNRFKIEERPQLDI